MHNKNHYVHTNNQSNFKLFKTVILNDKSATPLTLKWQERLRRQWNIHTNHLNMTVGELMDSALIGWIYGRFSPLTGAVDGVVASTI